MALAELSWAQERLYRNRCDIWRPTYPVDADGDAGDTTYTLDQAGVHCLFVTKSAVDNPQIIGLLESDDLMTVDELHLAEQQAIETNWIVVNKTFDKNGAQSKNYGEVWIVRGSPKDQASASDWDLGKRTCYLTKVPPDTAPAEIREALGLED